LPEINEAAPVDPAGGNGQPPEDPGPLVPYAEPYDAFAELLADWVVRHMLCRRNAYGFYTEHAERRVAKQDLVRGDLIGHFRGERTIGLFPISTDQCSKWGTFDVDFHDPSKDDADANWACSLRAVELLAGYGLTGHVLESDGNGGYHIRFFLRNPVPPAAPAPDSRHPAPDSLAESLKAYIPSAVVFWACRQVVAALQVEFPAIRVETFPKQARTTPEHPYGNWIRLFGRHHKTGCWARVWDPARGEMLEGEDFARYVLAVEGDDPAPLIAAYEADLAANPPVERPDRDGEDDGDKPAVDEVRSALAALDDKQVSDYEDWIQVGMALHSWDHFDGLELWKEFSARDEFKYDGTGAECESKWRGFSAGGSDSLTIRSLFRRAYDAGWGGFRPPATPRRNPLVGEDGWPALRLGKLPPVPDFPLEVLPPVLRELSLTSSRAAGGVDPGMIASALLVVAGGMIGRSLQLCYSESYYVSACLYHGNIARSGHSKSPVTRHAAYPVGVIEQRLRKAHAVLMENYRKDMKQYKKDLRSKVPGIQEPDRPRCEQFEIDDITTEAVIRTMAENPRGLMMPQHELSGLMDSFGQYKAGKGNDRQYYNKFYDGDRVKKNRDKYENNEPLYVPYPFMPIVGSMPPSMLTSLYMGGIGDGLFERFTLYYPDPRPRLKADQRGHVPYKLLQDWMAICDRLFNVKLIDSTQRGPTPDTMYFSPDALDLFDSILDQHVEGFNSEDYPDDLRSVYPKAEDRAKRYCLILPRLWHAADPDSDMNVLPDVQGADAVDAWKVVDCNMAHHIRGLAYLENVGAGKQSHEATLILNWIKRHPDLTSFSTRDLLRVYQARDYDRALIEDAIKSLVAKCAIRPVAQDKDGDRPKRGRPHSPIYEISPQLREMQEKQKDLAAPVDPFDFQEDQDDDQDDPNSPVSPLG
jgi:hypothetical protein